MRCLVGLLLILLATLPISGDAQTLYKYRGENGEWIFSDRPPDDGQPEETRSLTDTATGKGGVELSHTVVDRSIRIVANNMFYAPVELVVDFDQVQGVAFPDPDKSLRWVLPPTSETVLLNLELLDSVAAPSVRYAGHFTLGDPAAVHRGETLYRVPFALATDFPVSQAYPDAATHNSLDSRYAVDIAVPIGTDVFAARAGVVFDVTDTNFRSGVDRERDGPAANIVRILHDDGTYALYAHLNWNTIRVRPGERVARGQYIADSGNTGFSTGPHLHFAVIQNAGMRSVSVPVRFAGANSTAVVPARGAVLTAY
jgi:hypothetical protein